MMDMGLQDKNTQTGFPQIAMILGLIYLIGYHQHRLCMFKSLEMESINGAVVFVCDIVNCLTLDL